MPQTIVASSVPGTPDDPQTAAPAEAPVAAPAPAPTLATAPVATRGEEPAPPVAPLTWEALAQAEHGEGEAYLALFRHWDVQYAAAAAQTPCDFASRNQLDCWHNRGTFRDLQHLNRPVLLKMISDGGRLFYAALLGIDGDTLRLGLGEREMKVSRSELKGRWNKEFTVLWRRPPGFVRTLRPGEKGDFAAWVDGRVSQLEGRKVADRHLQGGARVYDFALAGRVRNLQRRCGLRIDGLVGRETIIMINSLTEKVPLLSKNVNRRCARRLNV